MLQRNGFEFGAKPNMEGAFLSLQTFIFLVNILTS